MTPAPEEIELSVERELPAGTDGAPRRARLTARFRAAQPGGALPTPTELAETWARLERDLEGSVAALTPVATLRPDRELDELVETYRPRQVELLDLLRAGQELTEGEHAVLSRHLAQQTRSKTTAGRPTATSGVEAVQEPVPALTDRPLAAAPLAGDRSPATPRPVPDLLTEYKIESLRQAGAVRARRQISYEEYMALKRHFTAAPAGTANSAPS